MDTNFQKIYLKAAEILEKRGWTRGTMLDEDNRVCALGAIAAAIYGEDKYRWDAMNDCVFHPEPEKESVYAMAAEAIQPYVPGQLPIHVWNDTVAERPEQVITLLRTAATHEKE